MFKYFYYLLASSKLAKANLFDYLEIAKKYGKLFKNCDDTFQESIETPETYFLLGDETSDPVFVHMDSDVETDCVFYKDLFFTISYDNETKDSVVRGYVKNPTDVWRFKKNRSGTGYNVLNPVNTYAEVYIAYNVNVLKVTRCCGENYTSGSWNKMFYRTLCSLLERVDELTEINRINRAYKTYKKKNQVK